MSVATMGRLFIMVCMCAAVLGSYTGCKKMEEKKEVKKVEKVEKKRTAVRKKKVATALKERERYEAFVGAKMRDYRNRIAVMKSNAAQSTGRAKIQTDRHIRELERRLRDVRSAYRTLTSSKGPSWNRARIGTDRAMNRFDTYYARVGR